MHSYIIHIKKHKSYLILFAQVEVKCFAMAYYYLCLYQVILNHHFLNVTRG